MTSACSVLIQAFRGTGSSCIYPLLGCSQRPKWRFAATGTINPARSQGTRVNFATDIDEKNIEYARSNIIRNNLKPRIRPLLTKSTDSLIPLDALGLERYGFHSSRITIALQLSQY